MKATFISRQAADLTAVNAARASMGKVRTVFDDSDTRLLAYLHRENHFTPFTHQRETFDMRAHDVKFSYMSETDTAGMVKSHSKGRVKMRHSIYGWANLIAKGVLDPDVAGAWAAADGVLYRILLDGESGQLRAHVPLAQRSARTSRDGRSDICEYGDGPITT